MNTLIKTADSLQFYGNLNQPGVQSFFVISKKMQRDFDYYYDFGDLGAQLSTKKTVSYY